MLVALGISVYILWPKNLSLRADPYSDEFTKFISDYGRSYETTAEFDYRFKVFKTNMAYIESMNAKNLSYKLGINLFADLTDEEFMDTYAMDEVTEKRELSIDYTNDQTKVDYDHFRLHGPQNRIYDSGNFETEGMDIGNYTWLDSKRHCPGQDWLQAD